MGVGQVVWLYGLKFGGCGWFWVCALGMGYRFLFGCMRLGCFISDLLDWCCVLGWYSCGLLIVLCFSRTVGSVDNAVVMCG